MRAAIFSFGYKIENVLEGKLLFAKEFSPKSLVKNRAESGFLNWDVDGLFGSKTRALKKQRADFEQSGAIIKKLHHAQIPSFVGIINANNTAYIVSELVHGSAWSSYLDVHKKITSHEVLQFFKVILPVIGYCHNQSIFHSDIQPSNIIISAGRLPVMVDFGAAIDLSSAQTPVAIKAITQGFSPPEVIAAGAKPISRSAIGPWIDLFSIAAVAFLSISGRLPQIGALETEINSLTYQHGAPPQLAAAIGWCLNIDANRRPRRVDDVLNLVQSGS